MPDRASRRRWRRLEAELAALRREHGRRPWRAPLPDLSVEQRCAPCSNGFAPISYRGPLPPDAKRFPIGNQHKQGIELITPDMMKRDLAWMSGRKT